LIQERPLAAGELLEVQGQKGQKKEEQNLEMGKEVLIYETKKEH
jgi:hypothetical protein